MMKKKRTSVGCLFWIALILLVLVVFLINRKTIENVLKTTGFLDVITREKESGEETPPSVTIERPEEEKGEETDVQEPVQILIPESEPQKEEETPGKEDIPELPPQMRRSILYFVTVADDGSISLKNIVRPVYYEDSPLTETLRSLIKGLTPSELNSGMLTLIPDGTVLHSVTVNNGIAYTDFSEEFRFNRFGVEGYLAQLRQVVYTATEFPTVTGVQILINGKTHDYLGPEGISIARPLTRDSF